MTTTCTLCGLSAPSHPITAPDVAGEFCCHGCLTIARTGIDTDAGAATTTRDQVQKTKRDSAPRTSPAGRVDEVDRDDLADEFLEIDGMHCTTCESFVGRRGESHEGIVSVEASYATDTARVRYDPERIDSADLPAALSGFGYTAWRRDGRPDGRRERDEETGQRLLIGVALAMLIMPWYVFFLYPSYVGIETGILTADMTTPVGLYFPMGVIALLASGVVFYTGWPILRGAYVSIRARHPNMDLLLSVAILSAFGYSIVATATGSTHIYYDVAVSIVLVVTAGAYYETRLKREAMGRLSELASAGVDEAVRRRPDGTTETVGVEALEPDDHLVVRPGGRVPIDGTVIEGTAAVDEAVLTGESLPNTRGPGDTVIGGSLVTDRALVIEVDENAENTLDRLTALVWAVQSERPGVQRFADRLATVFVPAVLLLGGGVLGWRLLTGESISVALLAGLTVIVAACPCAMGLATPLAVAGGLRDALRRGIVVTNSSLFETAPAVDTIAFDKTGTLTSAEMTVQSVVGSAAAIRAAATVEALSSHPVAAAIVEYARGPAGDGWRADGDGDGNWRDSPPSVADFERYPGQGVSGRVDGERIVVGTPALIEQETGPLPDELRTAVANARGDGNLPVVVGRDGKAAAVAIVGDQPREEWAAVMDAFTESHVVILTGDDEPATTPFHNHRAVDQVFAGIPPEAKAATVRGLRSNGTVAMVGDGTNDAPALGAADVGIALSGTAKAADAADIAVVSGSLSDIPAVFDLAVATRRRIRENIGWAFCYNGIAIPLAVMGALNPLLAAVAMAASSVLVVTNSKRRVL